MLLHLQAESVTISPNVSLNHAYMVEAARAITLHIPAFVRLTQWEITAKYWFVI